MLFGYLGAVLAGFLLTAVPNWTGRLPLVGWPLATLFAIWAAGRAAVLISSWLPVGVAAVLDLAFPLLLGAMILREILAGQNWKNLVVLGLLAAFTLANLLFHLDAAAGRFAAMGAGLWLGLAAAVMMVALIGGRIVPSFTRNWLASQGVAARPAPPVQLFDWLVLLASAVVLLIWVVRPAAAETGAALILVAGLQAARMLRWQGHRTWREPLVLVLHVAYGFVPLRAAALGIATLAGGYGVAATQHLWMVGAVGGMTLAVMTRATLGHSGRALHAGPATVAIYAALFAAVLARLGAGAVPGLTELSGLLWLAAFGGFALVYTSLRWR